ncbi:MAG: hypothetical protein J3K34DRAFT_444097 [Monoraphidium minutum]|nr:MAG: hypothetical protein J3K34DRAFT_444097 [Monoraphidium minutum]
MRGFLQSLNLVMPQGEGAADVQMHWAAQTFVPRLLGQEKFIFDELVSYVWTHTLVPKVGGCPLALSSLLDGGDRARARAPSGPSLNKRGAHEAALRKWLEAVEAANAQLTGLGRDGHTNTLRQQVLLELMKRIDALLFYYLVNPDASNSPDLSDDTPGGVVMDARNPNMPVLDESMLFFGRGVLTFGTGMQLKMACTRLQQWAFGEGGLRDIWAQLPEQGQALFRLLKGASDLLMMPKDMLLDDEIREDTVALPVGTVAYICSRFAPDDYAPDRISPQVTAALQRAATMAGVDASAPPALEVEADCTYYSPTDDMVMEQVEIGNEPGLEYDDVSEDELNAVSDLGADFGVPPPLRFKLLHNLWSAGVPRSRRVTIQRVED